MLRMRKFHYKTMMGKHVMVTWNVAMARRQLSTAVQGRAIAWLQDGATQWNIPQRLNVSQSIIGRLWIRFLDMGNVASRPRSGRPRSTTQREDWYLTNWTLHQRSHCQRAPWPLTDNHRHLNIRPDSKKRTPGKHLWPRRPEVLPPLLQSHGATRWDWCTLHVHWQCTSGH